MQRLGRVVLAAWLPAVLLGLAALVLYAAGPSFACLRPSAGSVQPGFSAREVVSSGVKRCYELYAPDAIHAGHALPVVFSLHGFASNPRGQRLISRWETIAQRERFLVVHPQGTSFPLRWNTGPRSRVGAVDDVRLIQDIVEDLARSVSIDRRRIFVTGISDGGALTHRIACDLSSYVAAAGIVSGYVADAPEECQPTRSVPLMVFFGTDDPILRYEGGRMELPTWAATLLNIPPWVLEYQPVESWVEGWAVRNGCKLTPERIMSEGSVEARRYGGCRGGGEVIFYIIQGGGHTWPGGPWIPWLGRATRDIDASELLWEFFTRHPLPEQP